MLESCATACDGRARVSWVARCPAKIQELEAGWNLKECEQASTETFGEALKSLVQNKTNGGALERVAGQVKND